MVLRRLLHRDHLNKEIPYEHWARRPNRKDEQERRGVPRERGVRDRGEDERGEPEAGEHQPSDSGALYT